MSVSKRFVVSFFLLLSVVIFGTQFASAQARPPIPRASQKASVMQTIGVTDVTVAYSRPAVKGRTIWGDPPANTKDEATLDDGRSRPAGMALVPNGHVWRTGANEATMFVVTDDVLVNGQPLAAGKYSLHTIPGKEEWTIIFNKDDGQWGSFAYDAKKDALRVKTKPLWVTDSKELLSFNFDPVTDNSATVNLRWEKIRVPFTVEVKDVVAATLAKLRPFVAAAKADDWRTPFQAGNYAMQNKVTDDAIKWFEQALKVLDASIAAKETFQNLSGKANVLLAAGRKDEALVVAEKAIARGKEDKADTAAFEKRIADIKAGKN